MGFPLILVAEKISGTWITFDRHGWKPYDDLRVCCGSSCASKPTPMPTAHPHLHSRPIAQRSPHKQGRLRPHPTKAPSPTRAPTTGGGEDDDAVITKEGGTAAAAAIAKKRREDASAGSMDLCVTP